MKKWIPVVLISVFLMTWSADGFAASPATQPTSEVLEKKSAETSEYLIGSENVLLIDVYYGKGEKISQRVRVSSRGFITFPLVGEIEIGGLTVSGLQEKLTDILGKDYLVNPQVTIFIEEYSTVSIMGEVKKPGVYPIKGRLSVIELISLAEGFTSIAAPNKVKVIRTNSNGIREELQVRINDIINKESGDKDNVVLRAGDMVIVPESMF
ncbi:MAG: polysaccharide biosynthesis/export family protein [Candidatus Omnitrophota bacterium]